MNGHTTCEPVDMCKDCHPPSPAADETGYENCTAIYKYKHYYIGDYY